MKFGVNYVDFHNFRNSKKRSEQSYTHKTKIRATHRRTWCSMHRLSIHLLTTAGLEIRTEETTIIVTTNVAITRGI